MAMFYKSNLARHLCLISKRNSVHFIPSELESFYRLPAVSTQNIFTRFYSTSSLHKEKAAFNDMHSENSPDDVPEEPYVAKACSLLQMYGVKNSDLKKYKKYLTKSPKDSYKKAKLLSEIELCTPTILPLLKLPVLRLKWVLLRSREDRVLLDTDFPDRISYLCHHLQLDSSDLLPLISKHSTLLTMEFYRLESKMSIFKNADISAEHLVKDLWIFNYNENLLIERIAQAKQSGIPIRPWILRCSEKAFVNTLSKWSNTQALLDGKDEVTYLAKRLDCSEDYVKHMMHRNKPLTVVNVPKLEKIINFLFEKGYTAEELRIFPRVFSSSLETLRMRFDDCYRMKGTMPTMSQLCFSEKNYSNYIKKTR